MSSMRPANASARSESYVVAATFTSRRSGDSSVPDRAHVCALRPGEPRRREVLQRLRRRRSRRPDIWARSAGSSRFCSSTSSASPSRAEKLDPEDVRAFLDAYYERVRVEIESFGGTVEKFIGDAVMGVFGAPTAYGDDAERAVRAAFAVRDWAEQRRARGADRREHRRGDRRARGSARARRGDGRRRRREHRRAAAVCRAGRCGARRRGDIRDHARRHRVPAGAAGRRKGQERARPGLARPSRRRRRSASARSHRSRWSDGSGNSSARRHLGARRRATGALTSSRSSARPGSASRVWRSSSSQLVAAQGGRVVRGRSTPYGAEQPVQRVRATGEAGRAGSSTATTPLEARARSSIEAIAQLAGPAAAEEHAPHLATLLGLDGDGDGRRPRDAASSRRACFVESLALRRARRCSCTRTSTGPTRACSTCSRRSPPASATCPCCSSRSRGRSSSPSGRAGAAGCPRTRRSRSSRSRRRRAASSAPSCLPRRGSRTTRAELVAETAEGNPLFIEELAAAIAEQRRRQSDRCPRASARSSPPGSTRSRPTERGVARRRVRGRAGSSGGARCSRSRRAATSPALLGSLEARDLIRREAVSRIRAISSSASSTV